MRWSSARLAVPVVVMLLALGAFPLSAQATFPGVNGKIAYVDGGAIWVMDPDGTGKTQLTSGELVDGAADWSPDGTRIVFARNVPGPGYGIFIMDADGSNQHSIMSPVFNSPEPSWS